MTSKLKCPCCGQELKHEMTTGIYCCPTIFIDCPLGSGTGAFGTKELWQELIRTRKALAYATDVIQTVAKMSNKLSREYGETFVEQLDNIQAYCWQEGYVLTHAEDLEKALTALE